MAGTLSKLPWYGQVGAFVGLSVAGLAAFFYLYASPMQIEMAQRQKKLDALQVDIRKGQAIARRLPQFRAEVAELEARLETLKNVLPEEKDMADLLRRLQTLAVRSNLTIRHFKPSPTLVVKELHAEVPITLELDGVVPQPGAVLRPGEQVPAPHPHQRDRHQGEGQAGAGFDDHRRPAWRRRSSCSRTRRLPRPPGRRRPPHRPGDRRLRHLAEACGHDASSSIQADRPRDRAGGRRPRVGANRSRAAGRGTDRPTGEDGAGSGSGGKAPGGQAPGGG